MSHSQLAKAPGAGEELACRGDRVFGELLVRWWCKDGGCWVEVFYRGELYVDVRLIAAHPIVPFSAFTEQGQFLFSGQIHFDAARPALILDRLRTAGGIETANVALCPGGSSGGGGEGPSPPPEEDAVITSAGDDLFPYIYLHPWPTASEEDRRDRFVPYVPPPKPPSPDLFTTLSDLKKQQDRTGMEQTAVDFVEGKSPWKGQFLPRVTATGSPLDRFSALEARLRSQPDLGLCAFLAEVTTDLGMECWADVVALLKSAEFRADVDRVWQNLFALAVLLGYDRRLLDAWIRTVVLERLLQRLAAAVPGDPSGGDGTEADDPEPQVSPLFPAAVLRQGLRATVVLPGEVFPLPPLAQQELSASSSPIWVPGEPEKPLLPYAVGDLHLVRRRLVGYVPGEVSRIENVARGEQKETTRRNRSVRSASTDDGERSRESSAESTNGRQADFTSALEATLKATFDLEYSTSYGPPTDATATGSLKTGAKGDDPASLDQKRGITDFAKELLQTAGRETAREVWRRRATSSLDEQEEIVVHRFDGSRAEGNTRAVYRWVNQVYEAWVEDVGRRLILEIFVRNPARRLKAAAATLAGTDLERPEPPAELGLNTFLDVSTDPQSDLFYASLAARYGVDDVEPPPAASRTTGVSFQSGAAVAGQTVELPAGYAASKAWLTLVSGDSKLKVSGVVGRASFTVSAGGTEEKDLHGETDGISVSVVPEPPASGKGASKSKGDSGSGSEEPATWVLQGEIRSLLGSERLEQWQLTVYRAVLAGYQRQEARYLETTGATPSPIQEVNPLATLEIVRRSLRQDVTLLLLERATRLLGTSPVPGEPRYLQFLDRALEWSDMAYAFTVRTDDGGDDDVTNTFRGESAPWTAFLQAGWARILLPVDPDAKFAVPYFLASGLIWPGPDALAPTHEDTLDLVNELKQAGPERDRPRPIGEPWRVEVPTAMVMLQDSSALPTFPRPIHTETPRENRNPKQRPTGEM